MLVARQEWVQSVVTGAAALFVCSACAGPLAAGEAAFRDGDYPKAQHDFAAIEPAARRWPPAGRAEFALYRGLTIASLGDVARAEPWLEEARGLEDAIPGSLSPDDARRLETAWQAWCSGCTPTPPGGGPEPARARPQKLH
ncbi:MAG: hypothetical protein FWD17_06105 [Polyangiaceae bacterium]|nr:hypothetical protein [Polyangiaceae bacterium]